MVLPSTLFFLLLLLKFVSGHLPSDDRTTRRPMKGDSEKGRMWERQQRSLSSQGNHECQEGSPLGTSYSGRMNVTASGRICQSWAAQQPHKHPFTDVGEHNYCRNPVGDDYGVWCYTTDPIVMWEYCSVLICVSKMKVLDFSADNDQKPDSNAEFTSATLNVYQPVQNTGFLPESFTICTAIMVQAWTTDFSSADMFTILNDGYAWGAIQMYAAKSFTEYQVKIILYYTEYQVKIILYYTE